jgi:hypothetical protein
MKSARPIDLIYSTNLVSWPAASCNAHSVIALQAAHRKLQISSVAKQLAAAPAKWRTLMQTQLCHLRNFWKIFVNKFRISFIFTIFFEFSNLFGLIFKSRKFSQVPKMFKKCFSHQNFWAYIKKILDTFSNFHVNVCKILENFTKMFTKCRNFSKLWANFQNCLGTFSKFLEVVKIYFVTFGNFLVIFWKFRTFCTHFRN